MLRWRFRLHLLHLYTGERGLVWTKRTIASPIHTRCLGESGNSISAYSTRSISDIRESGSFQLKGIQSLKQPLHTSTNDNDDDFAELGSPVEKQLGMTLKLITEKPESFKKTNGTKKASRGSSLKGGSCPSLQPRQSALHLVLKEQVEKQSSSSNTSSSVTIENIPSMFNLSQLKEAMSVYGKVSSASMRSVPNGLDCCDIEFESIESSRKAISVGSVTVNDFNLSVRSVPIFETVTIRINNVSSETTDSAIHSACTSCGLLKGLVRTKGDAVDVLFSVRDKSDTQRILEKLNSTIMDDSKWSAYLKPSKPTWMTKTVLDDDGYDVGLQLSRQIDEVNHQLLLKKIYTEDLKVLHDSLLHLENHPTRRSNFSSDENN